MDFIAKCARYLTETRYADIMLQFVSGHFEANLKFSLRHVNDGKQVQLSLAEHVSLGHNLKAVQIINSNAATFFERQILMNGKVLELLTS